MGRKHVVTAVNSRYFSKCRSNGGWQGSARLTFRGQLPRILTGYDGFLCIRSDHVVGCTT